MQLTCVERVLAVVAVIPPGNVSTYGEVAKVAGCGARQVGYVMRHYGAGHPWWRVVRADGTSHDINRAAPHYLSEGIEFTGSKVRLDLHGLDHADLRDINPRL